MTLPARPSMRVPAAALVAYILSAVPAVVAVGLISAVGLPQNHAPGNTRGVLVVQFFIGALLFPIAALGCAVATGLLHRRNWARIGALVWAALLICISGTALLVGVLIIVQSPVTGSQTRAGEIFFLLFFLVQFLIGVWWQILFTRKDVAAEFTKSGRKASR